MAGTESSEKPVFKLKLLVDKKRDRVVLAEAGKEFVDVLFSFLTLPMGTIVRLLEKHQQNQKSQAATIGCFNNLYKSVVDIGTASFMTEACRDMLLYPRNLQENERKQLKLNIDDSGFLKHYKCADCKSTSSREYSNFCSSRCSCGSLMGEEFESPSGLTSGEIFVSDKTMFSISDNMKVGCSSMGFTLKTLKELGYSDVDQLHEVFVDVDQEKVLALLQSLFSSDTALTDVFLRKRSSCAHNMPSQPMHEETGGDAESKEVVSISMFSSKLEKKVLYVEGGKELVDLLFTFLALPLNAALKLSGSNIVLGCMGNLCESFKSLRSNDKRNLSTNRCVLPWYYSCHKPLLDVYYASSCSSRTYAKITPDSQSQCYFFSPMDPKRDKNDETDMYSGFVKKETMFMVSDELIITPMNLSSTICSLKKWNVELDDIEEQVINITKAEVIRLLRASFITSTALNTVFGSLLLKKLKREKL